MELEKYMADLNEAREKLNKIQEDFPDVHSIWSLRSIVKDLIGVIDLILGKDEGK